MKPKPDSQKILNDRIVLVVDLNVETFMRVFGVIRGHVETLKSVLLFYK